MSKLLHQITQDRKVGIYENAEKVARVYDDKIILTLPYVKWIGNTGGYAEKKISIRDMELIAKVHAELADECVDSAWDILDAHVINTH